MVLAEPPRYRPQYQQQRQYYFARLQEEAVDGAAPYPASGWKPAGRAFNLPERQFAGAQQQYGAPSASQQPEQQYGAPSASQQPEQQYGAPTQREYGAPEEPATTESPNNDDEEVSTVQGIASSEVSKHSFFQIESLVISTKSSRASRRFIIPSTARAEAAEFKSTRLSLARTFLQRRPNDISIRGVLYFRSRRRARARIRSRRDTTHSTVIRARSSTAVCLAAGDVCPRNGLALHTCRARKTRLVHFFSFAKFRDSIEQHIYLRRRRLLH